MPSTPSVLPNPVQEKVDTAIIFSFRLSTQPETAIDLPKELLIVIMLDYNSHAFGSQKQKQKRGHGHAKLENSMICTEHGPSKKPVRC